MYGYYDSEPKSLFCETDGSSARRNQVAAAAVYIDKLSENYISAKTDEEIVSEIVKELEVIVPTLKRNSISFKRETKNMRWQNAWGEEGHREVPAFVFTVPFEGEEKIFDMRPNTYSLSAPHAVVRSSDVLVTVINEEDPQKLKTQVDATLDRIDEYLGWHRQMWAGIEGEIATAARQRLTHRREAIAKLSATETGLSGLGFKPAKG